MNKYEYEDVEHVANDSNFEVFKNKTVLISGGTGLVGSFLCNVFKYRNDKYMDNIKVISLSRRGGEDNNTVKYVKCDINKGIDIDDDIDYIIHLASNTHPLQYAEDPVGTITTNVLGCYNLLQLAVSKKIKRFFLASSVEIYGEGKNIPMSEDYSGYIDCNQARSGYNEAKRLCESLCQSFKKQFGVDFITGRLSRIIGPDHKKDSKAISQFIDKALAHEDIVLKSKGNQLYSYCYISDIVSAILLLMSSGESGNAYNISSDFDGKTLGDYAHFIAHLSNNNVIYDIETNSSVSKATYAILDCTKIKSLGWHAKYSVCDAIRRTYLAKEID